ncbi:hypothetical protein ACOME3_007627 [Neoechinorhynchus agilis]
MWVNKPQKNTTRRYVSVMKHRTNEGDEDKWERNEIGVGKGNAASMTPKNNHFYKIEDMKRSEEMNDESYWYESETQQGASQQSKEDTRPSRISDSHTSSISGFRPIPHPGRPVVRSIEQLIDKCIESSESWTSSPTLEYQKCTCNRKHNSGIQRGHTFSTSDSSQCYSNMDGYTLPSISSIKSERSTQTTLTISMLNRLEEAAQSNGTLSVMEDVGRDEEKGSKFTKFNTSNHTLYDKDKRDSGFSGTPSVDHFERERCCCRVEYDNGDRVEHFGSLVSVRRQTQPSQFLTESKSMSNLSTASSSHRHRSNMDCKTKSAFRRPLANALGSRELLDDICKTTPIIRTPILIRETHPPPRTPPPMVLREKPPSKLLLKRRETPDVNRQIIYLRYRPDPPKPRNIIVERWVPPPQSVEHTTTTSGMHVNPIAYPRNVLVDYDQRRSCSVCEPIILSPRIVSPTSYMEAHRSELIDSATLEKVLRQHNIQLPQNDMGYD